VFTYVTPNGKGEIERKFPKSQKGPNFGGFRAWGQRLEKVSIFTAKGTCIRESTSFKPFCVKIGWGCGL